MRDGAPIVRRATLSGACDVRPVPAGIADAYVFDPSFDPACDPCVVALGAFDGVHLGHRALIDEAISVAHERSLHAVAVTFDPDPSDVLFPDSAEPKLLSCADRVRALSLEGLAAVVSIPFDRELASTPYDVFVRDILLGALDMRALRAGSDFRVGARGEGTMELLSELGAELGFDACGVELARHDGGVVSATRIRTLLEVGETLEAASLLGRHHFVRGEVVRGRGEGTGLGFPTANISCERGACLPARGVYAGYVRIDDAAWPAAINVGSSPTLDEERQDFLEASLLGFSGDLYGRSASVVFCEMLRRERVFASREDLIETVLGNVEWVRENLGEMRLEVGA